MVHDVFRMVRREELLPNAVAFVVSATLAVALFAVCKSGFGSWACLVLFGGIGLAISYALFAKARFRYRELCKGHCPDPLCHGVVQHSPHLPPTMVRCPTCGKSWPAPRHIDFKVTSRQW